MVIVPLQFVAAGAIVNVDTADFTSGQPANEATTYHDVVPAGTMRVSSLSVVSPAESAPRKSVYFVAPGTSLHVNSTGETTFVAPFAGARSVGGALLHVVAVVTVNVDAAENVDGQLSKRASTSQFTLPCGTATVSVVVVDVPSAASTRYELAPGTALHWNVTGEATLAPLAGARSDGEAGLAGQPLLSIAVKVKG